MKKVISFILVLVLVISLVGALYATTEITTDCKTVELTKIEGLKNSLGVQNLDIRIGGFDGYRLVRNCCFEDIYFDGSEQLNVSDINNLKILIYVDGGKVNKWISKTFNLENGKNECIWKYEKDGKEIKIMFTFWVNGCTQTTAVTTTEASTTTAITTSTPEPTQTIENTTAVITSTSTPEITTTPETTGEPTGTLPNTGEKDLNFLIVIGIVLVLIGGIGIITKLIMDNN